MLTVQIFLAVLLLMLMFAQPTDIVSGGDSDRSRRTRALAEKLASYGISTRPRWGESVVWGLAFVGVLVAFCRSVGLL